MGLFKSTKRLIAQKFDSKTAGLGLLGGKIADSATGALDRAGEGTKSIFGGIKDLSKKAGQAVRETAVKAGQVVKESAVKVGQGVLDLKHEMDDASAVTDQIYYKMGSIKAKATDLYDYLMSVYTNNGKDADPKKIATATELWHELITLALYPIMKKTAYHGLSNDITSYDIENSRARRIVKSYIAHQRAVNRVTDRDTDTKIRFDISDYLSKSPENLQHAVRVRPGKLLRAIDTRDAFARSQPISRDPSFHSNRAPLLSTTSRSTTIARETFANAPKKTKKAAKTTKATKTKGKAKKVTKKTSKPTRTTKTTKTTKATKSTRGLRELHSLGL